MKRQQKTIGQRRLPSGNIQVIAKVNGEFFSKVFPATSTPGERNAWRDRTIAEHGGRLVAAGSFAADAQAFLDKPEVAAMPSIAQYTAILQLWIEALGADRPRRAITRDDIEAVLQRWLKTLSPVTVYHRRTVLLRMYVVLDGDDMPNPVKHTTRPDHYRPVDKSLDPATVQAILDAMPWSLSKLRATIMAHTGIPAAEIMKLKPGYFDRHAGTMHMPWRNKGAGSAARPLELSADGVAAFVALDAANGWGLFAVEALGRSFKRAAKRVLGPSTAVSPYWLRHSLGKDLYRTTRDLETVRRQLGHAVGSPVTARYAMGANAEVDRAALAAVSAYRAAQLAAKIPPENTPGLPLDKTKLHVQVHAELHGRRKPRKAKRLRAVS